MRYLIYNIKNAIRNRANALKIQFTFFGGR